MKTIKVRGQVEKCLEPVRLCDYACSIKNEMCQGKHTYYMTYNICTFDCILSFIYN